MIRFIVTLLTALALFCSQASAGFLLNSFAVKSPLVFVGVLAFFVVATAAFENDTAAFAASRLLELPHG